MPVGLVPIDHAASVLCVALHVLGATHRTAVLDSSRLDALENRIKFFLIDPEAEVLDGKGPSSSMKSKVNPSLTYTGENGPTLVSAQRTPSSSARRLAETR